jgi:hypothetical protein
MINRIPDVDMVLQDHNLQINIDDWDWEYVGIEMDEVQLQLNQIIQNVVDRTGLIITSDLQLNLRECIKNYMMDLIHKGYLRPRP